MASVIVVYNNNNNNNIWPQSLNIPGKSCSANGNSRVHNVKKMFFFWCAGDCAWFTLYIYNPFVVECAARLFII